MKRLELIDLLEKICEDNIDVIIDVGRYADSNWKRVEDVDFDYVNEKKVIVVR